MSEKTSDTKNTPGAESTSLRVDKWLWHARFFKTRTLAAKQVSEGKIRVNSTKISKPARMIATGDVLTFPKDDHVRVIKVLGFGTRRGPAPEAQALYEDLDPPKPREKREDQNNFPPVPRYEGKGRPTKKDRRNMPLSGGSLLD
ncbi:RNA-binding S4 domain-containing protein [Halocynthiibacter styelae]|uniref:RNA-binding S4 domain-containing protein n=1 Tax=Halocynthiibacter styelae TaxID=2761955 RepID=A0A8J7IY91_9RHOB|nr:RNA-binding S4 domain-containing protein [Paenihalocynthiibacter styelae]MBI1494425.1 RNA-binding S4 domain-containing protein [Paenihalocynthiibacter styelae]